MTDNPHCEKCNEPLTPLTPGNRLLEPHECGEPSNLPPDGACFLSAPHWKNSYVGHVKGEVTTLWHGGKWWSCDTETLVGDKARFLRDGKDYRDE